MKSTRQLVMITWLDAQDHKDTWVDAEDAERFTDEDCKIMSVGFLIRQTAKYVTIGGDWDEADKDYGTVRKIPVGMVQSMETLTYVTQPAGTGEQNLLENPSEVG